MFFLAVFCKRCFGAELLHVSKRCPGFIGVVVLECYCSFFTYNLLPPPPLTATPPLAPSLFLTVVVVVDVAVLAPHRITPDTFPNPDFIPSPH